jgi:uncharacterized protein YndB with AHSA1/START domain
VGTTEITAPAGVPFIDISREFDAPRELLYRAYTEPELVKQWLGPSKYEMVIDRWEPRDGGTWRYVHRDDDGNAYGFHGVFHGPQTVDGMLQTFEFEGAPGHVSLDSLNFDERGGRTVIRTHSVYQSLEARDAMVASGMGEGVNEGFKRLDELIARLKTLAPAGAGSAR